MIKNEKNRPKHVRPQTVDLLRNLKYQLGVIDEELAAAAGTCRSYINLMLNHRVPMPIKYYEPLDNYLLEREKRNEKLKASKVYAAPPCM